MKIKDKVVNEIGCFVAKWILHNCDDGLVVNRKGGAKQVIKVFAEPAYRNMIRPAIYKATKVIKVGDVVTDEGYHREVVITRIDGTGENASFRGYYLSDGVTVTGLKLSEFKKIISHVDVKVKS